MERITAQQVKMVRGLQTKKHRDELGCFVAEGEKCIGELRQHFEMVLYADATNATRVQLEQMSGMRTPQGAIAVFRKPTTNHRIVLTGAPNEVYGEPTEGLMTLLLDGIQDPGNLGTIIRTADWFGIRRIVCSRETADCFAPKVVQATMGALGRVQVQYTDLIPYLRELPAGTPVYGTLLNGRNMYEDGAIIRSGQGVIIMGNEGNGISEDVRALITHPLYIPSGEGEHVESLNVAVATAIVLAEFNRK